MWAQADGHPTPPGALPGLLAPGGVAEMGGVAAADPDFLRRAVLMARAVRADGRLLDSAGKGLISGEVASQCRAAAEGMTGSMGPLRPFASLLLLLNPASAGEFASGSVRAVVPGFAQYSPRALSEAAAGGPDGEPATPSGDAAPEPARNEGEGAGAAAETGEATTEVGAPVVAETSPAVAQEDQTAVQRLTGFRVTSVRTNKTVELSKFLTSGEEKSMLIFGTYAADFNAIEYVQRLRYYLPQLESRGIRKLGLVLNAEAGPAKALVEMADLKTDATSDDADSAIVQLFVDPIGAAGRRFGVGRGWRPDDGEMSPYVKLFGMLLGLGAWATLPAVIGGYIGNPFTGQPWIEDALAVGQREGRWPDMALELEGGTGAVAGNKFTELPVVGAWERRPLELATLRLQNMLGISFKRWKELSPGEEALKAGVLTQLGGAVVVDCKSGVELFRWTDPGICAVANFEDILKKIPAT